MRAVHDRMPVALEPDTWPVWLGEEAGELEPLMRPASDVRALDIKAGNTLGKCMARHGAEFRRFLDMVEKNVPANLDVHVATDNASSHKTRLIRSCLQSTLARMRNSHPSRRPGSTRSSASLLC